MMSSVMMSPVMMSSVMTSPILNFQKDPKNNNFETCLKKIINARIFYNLFKKVSKHIVFKVLWVLRGTFLLLALFWPGDVTSDDQNSDDVISDDVTSDDVITILIITDDIAWPK